MMGARVDFTCPHCQQPVAFILEPADPAIRTPKLTSEEKAQQWLAEAPEAVKAFLAEAERTGVFATFAAAVKDLPDASKPNNLHRFFLMVVTKFSPITVKRHVLDRIIETLGGRVEVWSANGIIAVTSNGKLRALVAKRMLDQLPPPPANPRAPLASDFGPEWIRTKFGYVTSPILLDDFRKRALGAWDTLTTTRTMGWK